MPSLAARPSSLGAVQQLKGADLHGLQGHQQLVVAAADCAHVVW